MGRFKERVDARFEAQERKGIEKYGHPLEDNHGSFDYRLEHLAQELTDGLMYVEWLKESGQIITSMFELLVQDLEKIKPIEEICPIKESCPEEYLDGSKSCLGCLKAHYEAKARDLICQV
jgi:hypothetical protein